MKVIFLDFDGVLIGNGYTSIAKMKLLKQLVDQTEAKIVISSSWRKHTLSDKITSLELAVKSGIIPFSLKEYIVGITPRMYAFKHGERETHFRIARGNVIQQYINEHDNIAEYVILDDSTDMLLNQKDNFVHIDSNIGLSEIDVIRATSILNK